MQHARAHACMHKHKLMHTHTRVNMHAHVRTQPDARMRHAACTRIHTHAQAQAHAHKHAHKQACSHTCCNRVRCVHTRTNVRPQIGLIHIVATQGVGQKGEWWQTRVAPEGTGGNNKAEATGVRFKTDATTVGRRLLEPKWPQYIASNTNNHKTNSRMF